MASTVKDLPLDNLTGELITPEDSGYDDARQVFLRGTDRKPLAIAKVANADDVATVVDAARESGLELAVRSGGHSHPGFGVADGGLTIDLRAMNSTEVDADAKTAWVETGSTAGQYTLATSEHGLVTGFGDTGSVGVGGITLAGGIGFLLRKHGLTIDNMLAAEVVTADGELVQVDEDSEPDLFWAIRGGGGNFGVVTRFQLQLAEVSEIVGGMLILPATPEVIGGFLEAAQGAPEELSTIANVMIAPPMPLMPEAAHGKAVLMGLAAYCGPVEGAEEVFAPFMSLAEPLADMIRPMRYPELFEGPEPEPQFATGANFYLDSLPSGAAETMLEELPNSSAPMKAIQLRALGGAMAKVPNDATAFGHRDAPLMANVACMFMDDAERETHADWVDNLAGSLGRNGSGGYPGFLGPVDESMLEAAYGDNWDRLRELKGRYDPDNLFHHNHNIPPAD